VVILATFVDVNFGDFLRLRLDLHGSTERQIPCSKVPLSREAQADDTEERFNAPLKALARKPREAAANGL
jgi:hypothetical protein